MKVQTATLVSALRQRGGPLDNAGFIDAYGRFVRDCLAGIERLDSGPYVDWIAAKLKLQGVYMHYSKPEDIPLRLAIDRDLIRDIVKRGILKPIQITRDACGLEVDGWHRVVIASVLGIKEIECSQGSQFL
jgi:hypothetical protein